VNQARAVQEPAPETMLEGRSIICFANDFEGDPTSKQHIMRILARRNRVLWVNSIGMRRPTASAADLRRMAHKLRRGLGGTRSVQANLTVVSPLVIPLPDVPLAARFNAAVLAAMLRRLSRRHGLTDPILWTFMPNVGSLMGRLGEAMTIYHCVDEYSAFEGVPREALLRMEQDLVRRADLVLTSAQSLCDARRPLNPDTHFVSHGVDVDHFAKALDPATEVPEDARALRRPVIGFFGRLDTWVDLDLVRDLALGHPEWSFVLVGTVVVDPAPVSGLANVHLLGQKPYSTLPGYCRGFDVGIIPFRVNHLTTRANPLKLREYLAAGLPVVSSRLPEVERYEGLVHMADGASGFSAAIEAALQERSPALAARRVDAMRPETWEGRVAEMCALIANRAGASRRDATSRSA
jgi:glycosyltransferase involved in cell wall biosynthesis